MSILHPRSGSSLLIVLLSIALISSMVGVIFNVTTVHARATHRSVQRASAIALGDAVLEHLYDQWRQAMISVRDESDRSQGLSNKGLAEFLSAPNSAELPMPLGLRLVNWSVTAADPLLNPLTSPADRPQPESGTNSKLRLRLYYLASVTVRFQAPEGSDTVTVQRAFVRAGTNLFDNFFFGTQSETEFHPGPPMYVNGTVYTRGNLYTGSDALHFLKDVTFTGQHFVNFRPEDSRFLPPSANPNAAKPAIFKNGLADNWDSNNPPRRGDEQKLLDTTLQSLDPNFLDDSISNDADSNGNPNDDGFHEIIEEARPGPDPLQLDSATSERLANNADYRIYVGSDNAVSLYKGQSTTPLAEGAEYTALLGAITTNQALRDVRAGDNVRVVNLDIEKIRQAADLTRVLTDSVGSGDGLLLYVADNSAGKSVSTQVMDAKSGNATKVTSNSARGVRLVNGGRLPARGLTVVSPNSVYIQGDYNSGKSGSTQPPSNTTAKYLPPYDTPSPVVEGYQRAPSAVVGDAVNILSNNWNDAKSLQSKGNRIASSTTINTAIVAGNVPTTKASYSGGIENFVRFHEDWNGKYYTIYGALAQLYASRQATRPWSNADYTPPNRRWYFDPLLKDSNPPGFRVARIYARGHWSLR